MDVRRLWHQDQEQKHMTELQTEIAEKEREIKNAKKRIEDGQLNTVEYKKAVEHLGEEVGLMHADLHNLNQLEWELSDALEAANM